MMVSVYNRLCQFWKTVTVLCSSINECCVSLKKT